MNRYAQGNVVFPIFFLPCKYQFITARPTASVPMTKKKVHKLKIEDTGSYKLLGISSHENDYRLSWAVNRKLGLNFRKIDNLQVQHNKNSDRLEFSVFQSVLEEKMLKMNLISNRCPDGFLIREMKNIDFLLQIFGETSGNYLEQITAMLKTIDIVSAVFEISHSNLKKPGLLPPE